jgi:hypothetical protein
MANVTVELNANQIIGAKNHFGTTVNAEALVKFQAWISENADGWYQDYIRMQIGDINAVLLSDTTKIAEIKTALGI